MSIHAQNPEHQTQPWDTYLEQLNGQEDFESTDWDSYYEQLSEMAENPMNINTMKKEDFETLPFLSSQQIEDIMAYLYQYGEMKSMGELAMIRSLGYEQQQLMRFFTYTEEIPNKEKYPSLKKIYKYGKHNLISTVKVPFYERKGDIDGYMGYKYKHWMKYNFSYGQYLKIGIIGSQDAGEPFMANKNKQGYDYYSFWLQIKKLGPIKNVVIGRYRLKFGLGLVMNSYFGLGKTATLSTLGRSYNQISAHSSRYSGNYLQGAAATVAINKHVDATGFFSYRLIDATLNKDSIHSIATIVKTGYHRTKTEMNKKNNAWQVVAGGNINGSLNGFHIGITGLYSTFDKTILPDKKQAYKKWYAEGQNFYNASIDYGYISGKLNFNGETATGNSKAIATLNTISYSFTQDFSAILLQRYYSCKYYSIYSNSFSEGSGIQDENGIYLGINWNISSKLSLKGYTDFAYFQWPQYLHTRSHKAWDNMLSCILKIKDWTFSTKHRLHLKDVEFKNKKTNKISMIAFEPEYRGRMAIKYDGRTYSGATQFDCCYSLLKGQSVGYMISESISAKWKWLRTAMNFGYFNTDDYYSRVYVYEQGTLYNLSYPMFYGHGIRYSLNVRGDMGSHWMVIAKIAVTNYFDRDHISSSYQQINKSSQADLDLQVRFKF